MKFGYRDRIILLVMCILIILGIGIFVFIRPKWQKLKINEQSLKDAQNNWDTQLTEFRRIPAKQGNIQKRYTKAHDISLGFTDEMDAVQMDEFLRETFFNNEEQYIENKVRLQDGLSVMDEGTSSLSYYYYTPSIVTYPLYELADLDGSLKKAAAEKRHDATILSSRSTQTVGIGKSTLVFRMKREDAWKFIDTVSEYAKKKSDAMRITRVSIADYDFNESLAEEEGEQQFRTEVDEEGNEHQVPITKENEDGEKTDKIPEYTNVTFEYEVYYMQEPTQPYVGPEYKESIWDGDEWRTARVELEEEVQQ